MYLVCSLKKTGYWDVASEVLMVIMVRPRFINPAEIYISMFTALLDTKWELCIFRYFFIITQRKSIKLYLHFHSQTYHKSVCPRIPVPEHLPLYTCIRASAPVYLYRSTCPCIPVPEHIPLYTCIRTSAPVYLYRSIYPCIPVSERLPLFTCTKASAPVYLYRSIWPINLPAIPVLSLHCQRICSQVMTSN